MQEKGSLGAAVAGAEILLIDGDQFAPVTDILSFCTEKRFHSLLAQRPQKENPFQWSCAAVQVQTGKRERAVRSGLRADAVKLKLVTQIGDVKGISVKMNQKQRLPVFTCLSGQISKELIKIPKADILFDRGVQKPLPECPDTVFPEDHTNQINMGIPPGQSGCLNIKKDGLPFYKEMLQK